MVVQAIEDNLISQSRPAAVPSLGHGEDGSTQNPDHLERVWRPIRSAEGFKIKGLSITAPPNQLVSGGSGTTQMTNEEEGEEDEEDLLDFPCMDLQLENDIERSIRLGVPIFVTQDSLHAKSVRLCFGDVGVKTTLRRCWGVLSIRQKLKFAWSLMLGGLSNDLREEDIENLLKVWMVATYVELYSELYSEVFVR